MTWSFPEGGQNPPQSHCPWSEHEQAVQPFPFFSPEEHTAATVDLAKTNIENREERERLLHCAIREGFILSDSAKVWTS